MVRLLLNPAEPEGARYLEKVVAEHSANSCMLIVHEALGRSCGWLTACTAKVYPPDPRRSAPAGIGFAIGGDPSSAIY
jgi:pyrophosphate--fructose-6-phosphate 1-phosphotransferase